jgi:hypothetical protein
MVKQTNTSSFGETLMQLGPLPSSAQEAVLLRLEELRGKYRPRQKGQRIETASRLEKRLQRIAAKSKELVRLLDGPNMGVRFLPWLTVQRHSDCLMANLKLTAEFQADVVARRQSARFPEALCLTDLLRESVQAIESRGLHLGSIRPRGRGGPRRVAAYDVRNDLFDLYADVRRKYPDSGREPGWGGPLKRFLDSALRALGVREPSEGASRGAFMRWKKRNPKGLIN